MPAEQLEQPEWSDWDGGFACEELLALLGDMQEPRFDDLAELCAASCGTPISLISLVGRNMVYPMGTAGLAAAPVPLLDSICAETVRQPDLFLVQDALQDPRFALNPLVVGKPHVRFYAAVTLFSSQGRRIGALSVMDTLPRALKPREAYTLRLIARQVTALLELRLCHRQITLAAEWLYRSDALLRTFSDAVPAPCYLKGRDNRLQFYNQRFAETFHVPPGGWLQKDCRAMLPTTTAERLGAIAEEAFALGTTTHRTLEIDLCSGGPVQWELHQTPCFTSQGKPMLAVVAVAPGRFQSTGSMFTSGTASTETAPMH